MLLPKNKKTFHFSVFLGLSFALFFFSFFGFSPKAFAQTACPQACVQSATACTAPAIETANRTCPAGSPAGATKCCAPPTPPPTNPTSSPASPSIAAATAAIQNSDRIPGEDGLFVMGIKWILYGLLNVLISFMQAAASVFAWATQPEYISGTTGLLNLQSVYFLWGFIRDFFNLAFIFLLLFSAFATVFQIEKFGIKKNFFKIVFAAIAINFSFPLTRIIIDLGNVPMYFFASGIVSETASSDNALLSIPMSFFETTGIGNLLSAPNPSTDGTLIKLLTAVIFTFIFMITLFVLAILFVIRLLKLVILLIFSPLGVAASIIPGLEKQGKEWWSQLLSTVIFGPAAMLMVVIALRFSQELGKSSIAQGTGSAASPASEASIISQGIFFIPIVFMWMAMHMGNKFGIEGSNAVMKKADAVANWGKKQALRPVGAAWKGTKAVGRGAASPITTRFRGYTAGLKSRYDDKIGKPLKNRGESVEARAKARVTGLLTREKGSYKKAQLKAQAELLDKRAREKEKEWKDKGKTPSDILKELKNKDNYEKDGTPKANALAAAHFLANERDGIKDADALAATLQIANKTGKKDLYEKALNGASDDALDMTTEQIENVRKKYKLENYKKSDKKDGESDVDYTDRLKKEEEKFDRALDGMFTSKYKKEGKMKVLIDYEIAIESRKGPVNVPAVYNKHMDKMKVKEIAKMQDIYDDATGDLDPEVARYLNSKGWTNKMKQDAFSELEGPEQEAWDRAGMKPL